MGNHIPHISIIFAVKLLFRYIFLETACGFIGDCHLDESAEKWIEITFTEFAFVFETTKFGYFG